MIKNKKNKKIIMILCLGVIIICSYLKKQEQLLTYSTKINELEKTELKEENIENSEMLINNSMPSLLEKFQQEYQNNDIKAVLKIENTTFQEPVVQTTDNEYYLTHNYKKEYDKLGSIYADYRINLEAGRKILIFGHSSTKKQTPFNTLEKYYDKDYYQQHKYITLQTNTNTYRYEIFSVYVETSDFTYMNLTFDSTNDWYLHLLKLQKKSLYKTDVELMNDDDVLILQTCSTNSNYKKYSKKYLLIVSRRVKE